MSYEVRIAPSAEKEMNGLPESAHSRISRAVLTLEKEPRPRNAKKLSGREEYSLRIGVYRVLYTIDDHGEMVAVLAVGHRRDVYR